MALPDPPRGMSPQTERVALIGICVVVAAISLLQLLGVVHIF